MEVGIIQFIHNSLCVGKLVAHWWGSFEVVGIFHSSSYVGAFIQVVHIFIQVHNKSLARLVCLVLHCMTCKLTGHQFVSSVQCNRVVVHGRGGVGPACK